VLSRRAYDAIARVRAWFGELDPFGDFDLLFGAARQGLKIVELPVRYRSRTYGDWPNQEDAKAVPDSASLAGAHAIKGNYSPEIRFSLDREFLDRVALSADGNRMRWNAVGRATGYFATLYGAQGQDEIVFWSSSEVQEMGGGLMDYLPPAEAARLGRQLELALQGGCAAALP